MKKHILNVIAPGFLAATAFALAGSAGAQTPPTPVPATSAKSPQAAPMPGHHKPSAVVGRHTADMKAECQAMMTKHQEMQSKFESMDGELDKLVAEMNAAKGSKEVGAMEKPMAAVINELVAQRRAARSMMMEMQPSMMQHMAHHMHTQATKGAMDCPMMKMATAPEPAVK